MAIRGDDAMGEATTTIPLRRVLAFDAVLAAAALGITALLADHLPIWLLLPVAIAIVANALIVAAVATAYARTVAADRAEWRAATARTVPVPQGPLVGVRAR